MKATMFCKANYLVFLNDKDEMIAYQIDDSTIKLTKFIAPKFPNEPPDGTKKTLVLNDVWSTIVYEKENISDIESKIVTYKMNESMDAVARLIKDNLNKSTIVTEIIEINEECPAFVPISKEHEDKLFQCEYCASKPYCYMNM